MSVKEQTKIVMRLLVVTACTRYHWCNIGQRIYETNEKLVANTRNALSLDQLYHRHVPIAVVSHHR